MNKELKINFMDYHWFLFRYFEIKYYSKNDFKIFKFLRDRPTEKIVKFHIESSRYESPLTLLQALRFLKNLQRSLENKASEIISKRCIYYWLHLYRRIGVGKIFGYESTTTLALYRNMTECCVQKYGKINCGLEIIFGNKNYDIDEKDIASGNYIAALEYFFKSESKSGISEKGVYLGKFNETDYLNIYIIERLMFEYWHITTSLRRLYKGGNLIIDNGTYYVINNENTEFLMKSFDNIEIEKDSINAGCSLIPYYNYKNISVLEYPFNNFFNLPEITFDASTQKPFIPNFLWFPFDFDSYFINNSFLMDDFYEFFGYTLECFVTVMFLIIFRNIYVCKNNKSYAISLIQNAYTAIITQDELIIELVDYSKEISLPSLENYELNYEEVSKVINYFKLNLENKKDISIATLGPRKIVLPSIDNKYIIDLSGISDIMAKQTHFITGKNVEKKGNIFEEYIKKRIKNSNLTIWECQKILKGYDSTSEEIDISFIDKNVLFICELKCINKSISYITGDFKSLGFRKNKFIIALEQSERKVDWILHHIKGRNFEVPNSIDLIVPIVISPFIEYIWDVSEYYWLCSDIPRVCNINELLELFKRDYIHDINGKSFVKILK